MKRRRLLQTCGIGLVATLAGCHGRFEGNPPPDRSLELAVKEVRPVDKGWQLVVNVSNEERRRSIKSGTVLAYSESGVQACNADFGELSDWVSRSKTLDCSAFPAIITAKISTPVCEGAKIRLIYWTGTEAQKQLHIPDELGENEAVYDATEHRQCDEALPPDRLLNASQG